MSLCAVCHTRPINPNFPGTIYCGNGCRLAAKKPPAYVHLNAPICAYCKAKPSWWDKSRNSYSKWCSTTCRNAQNQQSQTSSSAQLCAFCTSKMGSPHLAAHGCHFCSQSCMDAAERSATVSGFTYTSVPAVPVPAAAVSSPQYCDACGIKPRRHMPDGTLSKYCSRSCKDAGGAAVQGQPLCAAMVDGRECHRAAWFNPVTRQYVAGCTKEHSIVANNQGHFKPR